MVKVHKRASKRVGTKQRSKITKKVKEHHRKSKRQAKKDPTWKSKKKVDPGIPNSYPYKEQLLDEIEKKRVAAEVARREAKEAHQNGKAKVVEEEDGSEVADEEEEMEKGKVAATSLRATPRQYRGTLSTFYHSLKEAEDPCILSTLFTLDARDPASWRVEEVERRLQRGKHNIAFVLMKADLIPLEVLSAWSAYLVSLNIGPVFPICSPQPAKNGKKARAGGGVSKLVMHLEELSTRSESKGSSTQDKAVTIIGIENSGKTSLADILASSLPHLTVFDTPSLVAASSKLAHLTSEEQVEMQINLEEEDEDVLQRRDEEAAHRILLRNAGAIFKVREPLPLVKALMGRVGQNSDLMVAFNVPAFTDLEGFLISVARTQGRMKKGSVPDTLAACRHVLRCWSMGELGYYAKAPPGITGVEQARKSIESDASLKGLVLYRKEWRQVWSGKEIRLTTVDQGLFGASAVAFTKPADMGEEVDEELDDDDEEADEDEPNDDIYSDEDDMEEEEEEED